MELEFILSAIGYAVGIGNVWRFPYTCARNGGGVFLIPYFMMLLVCGIPLFFLELGFGQYSQKSPLTIFNSIPLFKGIGWAMLIASFLSMVYYNVVICWAGFYQGLKLYEF